MGIFVSRKEHSNPCYKVSSADVGYRRVLWIRDRLSVTYCSINSTTHPLCSAHLA